MLLHPQKHLKPALGRGHCSSRHANLFAEDATYQALEAQLSAITSERDALAAQMIAALEAAEFAGRPLEAQPALHLIARADELLERVRRLAR